MSSIARPIIKLIHYIPSRNVQLNSWQALIKPWDGFCGPLEVRTHPLPPPDSDCVMQDVQPTVVSSFGCFVFDLGCFVFDLGCFVFEFWVLRFRSWVLRFRVLGASFSILGASFSSFGCFVLRSRHYLHFLCFSRQKKDTISQPVNAWNTGSARLSC